MMAAHDPQPAGPNNPPTSPLDGESQVDPKVSGVVSDCHTLEQEGRIYFDVAGDLERLEDRGVGFPECEFDMNRRGNRGR